MKKQIYCFIGLPASGKGTQAMSFAEKRGFAHISIGDIVRDAMKNSEDLELRERFTKRYNEGALQPDEEVYPLLEKRLSSIEEPGVVFDNFPFNKGQSDFLLEYATSHDWEMPKVIYIKIDPEFAIKRISSRRICPNCKSVYVGGEVCEKCGTKLITRDDDNEETVRVRIGNYMPNVEEVVSIFRSKNLLFEINGEPSIAEVREQVEKIQ